MAGEHVKDAKQATGVRATHHRQTDKVMLLKRQRKRVTLLKKSIIVTLLLQSLLILELGYYLAMHNTTEHFLDVRMRRERVPKVVHANFMQL